MRRDERHAGFTLLEVLAAVAVLGLVYSVLATAAIEGLRAEGDAARRLRASLLADQRMTEIEEQVAMGQMPDLGTTEAEEDEFIVRTEVKPLDPGIAETKASKRAQERLDRMVGARPAGGMTETGTLLHPTGKTNQPLLRRIDLEVVWTEGTEERRVHRTTYGIDIVAAAPLIEQLVAAAQAEKAQQATGDATRSKETGAADAASPTSGSSGASSRSTSQRLPVTVLPGADPGTDGSER